MAFDTKLYNPAEQSEEWLINHFVARTNTFREIFEDIKASDMKYPEQNYLIQGQRGMGKTTLLLRLKYEIERTPELNSWLIPIFFNEESYDLMSLSNLWEKLLQVFDEIFLGNSYYDSTEQYLNSKDYELTCYKLVLKVLRNNGKKIILLFDNFGELFLDNLNETDSHRFREVLQTCPDIRIIAASSVVLESHNDYKAPFYDFFKVVNLKGLNKGETLELVSAMNQRCGEKKFDIEKNKARVETLSTLSGGVIRTIIMLYEILVKDKTGAALKDLEVILDRVTPLYKHRMEDLKPNQRRIVDIIAKKWDAISAKEISANIRDNGHTVPTKIISAQLQELERNNVIEKRRTDTKNHLYMLKERFFNIWYLMRHGNRASQMKVRWLTKFLEAWYENDSGGIDDFAKNHLANLSTGEYVPSSAILIANALIYVPYLKVEELYHIMQLTQQFTQQNKSKGLLFENVKGELTNLNIAKQLFNEGDYENCLKKLNELKIEKNQIFIMKSIANMLLGRYEEAIKIASLVKNEYESLKNEIFGQCYFGLDNFETAIEFFSKITSDDDVIYEKLYYLCRDTRFQKKALEILKSKDITGCQRSYFWYLIASMRVNNYKNELKVPDDFFEKIDAVPEHWHLVVAGFFLDLMEKIEPTGSFKIEPHPTVANFIHELNKFLKKNYDKVKFNYLEVVLLLDFWLCNEFDFDKEEISNSVKLAIEKKILKRIFVEIAFLICCNLEMYQECMGLILNGFSQEVDMNRILLGMRVLLVKKQYHLVKLAFDRDEINLKDKLKPMYFALAYILREEMPNEYLRMGRDLIPVVAEILESVEYNDLEDLNKM